MTDKMYNEKVATYNKYRFNKRYTVEHTCGGGRYLTPSEYGVYVKTDKGDYLDITLLECEIEMENKKRGNYGK